MNKISEFKDLRERFKDHFSMPIDGQRSKLDLSDREVSGYAIVWDSINDYGEIVRKGATLKSLNARGVNSNSGNKIQFLLQHDQHRILGIITELREDDYGLFFKATISEGVNHCNEALIQIREGLLKQLSYGFNYVWTEGAIEYDSEREIYILNEIMLHEISLVTFSSDPNAQLRSYGFNQMQLRLSEFSSDQINKFMQALAIYSTADEATRSTEANKGSDIFNLLKEKF